MVHGCLQSYQIAARGSRLKLLGSVRTDRAPGNLKIAQKTAHQESGTRNEWIDPIERGTFYLVTGARVAVRFTGKHPGEDRPGNQGRIDQETREEWTREPGRSGPGKDRPGNPLIGPNRFNQGRVDQGRIDQVTREGSTRDEWTREGSTREGSTRECGGMFLQREHRRNPRNYGLLCSIADTRDCPKWL